MPSHCFHRIVPDFLLGSSSCFTDNYLSKLKNEWGIWALHFISCFLELSKIICITNLQWAFNKPHEIIYLFILPSLKHAYSRTCLAGKAKQAGMRKWICICGTFSGFHKRYMYICHHLTSQHISHTWGYFSIFSYFVLNYNIFRRNLLSKLNFWRMWYDNLVAMWKNILARWTNFWINNRLIKLHWGKSEIELKHFCCILYFSPQLIWFKKCKQKQFPKGLRYVNYHVEKSTSK